MSYYHWNIHPLNDKQLSRMMEDAEVYKTWLRLNSLGSLFFFAHHVLGKNRLGSLHQYVCSILETDDLHLVLELPMGFYKTTIGTEALSMWWALPFTERDEYAMRYSGFGDEWIRWMKHAHNQNARTLVTHAVEKRSIAMGNAIDAHYRSNDIFRMVFDDVIPDGSMDWNDHTKFQKRTKANEGEDLTTGTFEYRGVGSALQGLHVTGCINDDSYGLDAQKNMLYGDGSIGDEIYRWWTQVSTRFDSKYFTHSGTGRHLIIGNRWGHDDLNSKIKANHAEFRIETHSAEGGCCKAHPANQSIFPEQWPMWRLQQQRKILSNYDYSHFMLNLSVLPEEQIFKPEWKRFYRYKQSNPELTLESDRNFLLIEHETVKEGKVREDVPAGVLHRRMLVDLAHAKKRKRCNHVILIVGWNPETDFLYLLDIYAKNDGYSALVDEMYKKARRWNMSDCWLETVAAQDLMKFHIEERNRRESKPLYVNELPYDNSENAKANRIQSLEPLFKNGQVWCHRGMDEFTREYDTYPASATIDVLDTLGYVPQILHGISTKQVFELLAGQRTEFAQRPVGVGGY